MTITPAQRQEFAACYEAYFWNKGFIPHDVADLNYHWQPQPPFTTQLWEDCLSSESLRKYFQDRAVPLPDEIQPRLKPKQLKFIATLLDPTNPKPLHLKLKETRTSSAEYSAWMRDEDFVSLLRSEADKKFQNGRTQVFAALEREATKPGANVQAIKLYLTLTGDYAETPASTTNVVVNQDLRLITQKLLEILQRHVPPETLALVHREMEQVLFPAVSNSQNRRATAPVAVESRVAPKNELSLT